MRRFVQLLVLLVFVGFAFVAAVSELEPLQDALIRREADRALRKSQKKLFTDDAMRVVVCGSASPMPDLARASACVAVIAGDRFYVVDTGLNSWENFALWGVPGAKIGAVLMTHFHSDHIAELGEFNLQTWVAGRKEQLRVIGPRGVEKLVRGFSEAYSFDNEYRVAHHGAETLPPDIGRMKAVPFDIATSGIDQKVVLEEGDLVITAFRVDHEPIHPAVGYRFDYRGRSVVVSGDTRKSASVAAAAKGADVLVHEAQANFAVDIIRDVAAEHGNRQIAKIMADIPTYHTSPVEAAELANEAGVKLLVLYHLTPPPPNFLVERIFVRGVGDVRSGGVLLANDGTLVELPIGSDAVELGRVD